jgi:hypothetical protein
LRATNDYGLFAVVCSKSFTGPLVLNASGGKDATTMIAVTSWPTLSLPIQPGADELTFGVYRPSM